MKKVLRPVDISDRALKSLERAKFEFDPSEVEITLVTVMNSPMHYKYDHEFAHELHRRQKKLESYQKILDNYEVTTSVLCGKPGVSIVRFAKQNHFDCIIMTRSKKESAEAHGSVSAYVAKKAPFLELMILNEESQRRSA